MVCGGDTTLEIDLTCKLEPAADEGYPAASTHIPVLSPMNLPGSPLFGLPQS